LHGFIFLGRLLQDTRYLHEKMSGLKHVGAPGGMLETVVLEKVVPGGTPVPVKKSRLSTKMAAVVAGAGTTGKENGKLEKQEQDKAPEEEERQKEGSEERRKLEEDKVTNMEKAPPSLLPEKGFRMDEPELGDTWKGEGEVEGEDQGHPQTEGTADDGTIGVEV
jgi:hypothetical protein